MLKVFQKGIPVCMGTDAYTHDMLESLKTFLVIQRHNAGMPNVAWSEATTIGDFTATTTGGLDREPTDAE